MILMELNPECGCIKRGSNATNSTVTTMSQLATVLGLNFRAFLNAMSLGLFGH